MRRFYKYAAWMAVAVFSAFSFAACDDDETENTPKRPTLELGTVNVTTDYEAAITVTPSKNATSFSWGYAAAEAEPETYTKVEGNAAVEVKTPGLAPGAYKIFAYAENEAGRSEIVTAPFEVTLGAPVVKFGEIKSSRAGITIPLTVIGAEQFSYAVVMQETGSTAEPAIPEQFRTMKTELLDEGNLVIEPEDLAGNGIWYVYAYAENEKGKGTTTKGSVEYDETKLPKLVEFEILNATAWSMDVKVTMLDGCARYVVGGYRNDAYNKGSFIGSAKASLNPDSFYPLQPFNWSDRSAIFPETLLSKNKLASSDESEGMEILYSTDDGVYDYQIAVYAVDSEGNGTAYVTEPFQVPAPAFGQTPTVSISGVSTPTSITPTFTAQGDCAKMYVGYAVPEYYENIDWSDEKAVVDFLSMIRGRGIFAYTGSPLTVDLNLFLGPNMEIVVYAIPITADGKVGKLCYEKMQTSLPAFDGIGNLTLDFQSATTGSLTFRATMTDAASARILCVPQYYFSVYAGNIEMVMWDEKNSNVWTEFTAAEIAAAGNTVTIGNLPSETDFVLRAVTVDANGRISPILTLPNQSTLSEGGGETGEIDFSKGKGEVKFNVIREEQSEEDGYVSIDLTYSVEKGANTVEAYRIVMSDMMDNAADIETECKDRLDPAALPTPITFDTEITQTSMAAYDPTWGGSAIAIVTKDTDGNFKIAHTYFARAK